MRHLTRVQKFHRTDEERKRLKIQLSRGLILNGQITTFSTRAKWFRSFFDRLVTLAKRADGDQKLIFTRLRKYFDEPTVKVFIEKVLPKTLNRQGGYTRIYKIKEPFTNEEKSIVIITE